MNDPIYNGSEAQPPSPTASQIETGNPSATTHPNAAPDALSTPWRWWREQMPIAHQWAYFDHAAVAPLSQPAADAIAEIRQSGGHPG